jgi:ABC-type polysaccharide/polyol phosphate export permease
LTKQFRGFLWSNMAPHAKCGIMGYIFSYYAISLACTTSVFNYVFIGIFG